MPATAQPNPHANDPRRVVWWYYGEGRLLCAVDALHTLMEGAGLDTVTRYHVVRAVFYGRERLRRDAEVMIVSRRASDGARFVPPRFNYRVITASEVDGRALLLAHHRATELPPRAR
jgi:hypothetical protein